MLAEPKEIWHYPECEDREWFFCEYLHYFKPNDSGPKNFCYDHAVMATRTDDCVCPEINEENGI